MALEEMREAMGGIGTEEAVQVAVSVLLVVGVLLAARAARAGLGTEPLTASLRGLVQVIAVGFLLAAILSLHVAWSALVLVAMAAIAATISRKRGEGLRGVYLAGFTGIAAGALVSLAAMLGTGALEARVRDVVPIGSVVIASCMRTSSLAFERFARESGTGADGAASPAVHAALIPAIDGMRSLGLVWIPGLMAGLVLAGASPVRAALLQFVVVAMILASAAVTALVATALLRRANGPPQA